MLKDSIKIAHFSMLLSVLNFLFFHIPFFSFVFKNYNDRSFEGILLIVSLIVAMLVANFFAFYVLTYISRYLAKVLLSLFFIINAVAIYFVNTYGVIIDESMIGNVFNTNYSESSSFFSFKLLVYVLLLGILPAAYIVRANITLDPAKKFFKQVGLLLISLAVVVFANSSNWLWIDKNSKTLGGLAMPWSYTVNTALYFKHKSARNQKEIPLPAATINDNEKSVVVLVIGESARSQNFSLYGYHKSTNPLLSKIPNVHPYNAKSVATYTIAGVKAILDHKDTGELYEILPNYLYRNNAEVIWRTNNWGEPPLHIKNILTADQLKANCKAEDCDYDEVLLTGLKEQIQASNKNKILVVLHTSTSHGPTYSKKYPKQFEHFKPVCNSVELGSCTHNELMNAYDNTIVYTDYLLARIINDLKQLTGYKSTMIFVSDHGESLGEKNLYMHGVPMSIAPKEQYEIPFIVWTDGSRKLKKNSELTQYHVFHSVLNFLNIRSPIYREEMNIYQ